MFAKHISYPLAFLLFWIAPSGFSSSFTSSDKGFLEAGAGAFVGEVVGFQLSTNTSLSEGGTVELRVIQVIAGKMSDRFVALPYSRTLVPVDEEYNWDLIEPKYISLRTSAIGNKFLIFFIKTNNRYFYAPGDNAVQDATRGLLLGRIKDDDPSYDLVDSTHRKIEVEIKEMIFGWLDGPVATFHGCTQYRGGAKESEVGHDRAEGMKSSESALVLVSFDKKGVCQIGQANETDLRQIRHLDSR